MKEVRRKEAEQRNAKWASLTPEQQLTELDSRLGKGIGATKQRAKIQKLIDSPVVKKTAKKGGKKNASK